MTREKMLGVALEETRAEVAEGGIRIGAAVFAAEARYSVDHNHRVQQDDPTLRAEVDVFRNAGRRRSYRDTVMVTTPAPCWYCSGQVRQFSIPKVVLGRRSISGRGEPARRAGRRDRLRPRSQECIDMLGDFIAAHPGLWHEDIGA